MKFITRNNYEEFFLDYIEGEISAQDKVALESFLAQNPDLKKELDEMMNIDFKCDADTISSELDSLKAIPFQENFDDFCIAKIEGDLNTYESCAFENYVASNPSKEKDFILYQKTKLEVDKTIIFKDKKSLKRRNKALIIRQYIYTTLAAAASIILLFSIGTSEIENTSSNLKLEQVSQNTNTIIAVPDSLREIVPKDIKLKKDSLGIRKKAVKPSKTKIKSKLQHKNIIRTDALPNRAAVSKKELINEITIKQLLTDNQTLTVNNINLPETKLGVIDNINSSNNKNTGLAMLGLSWKASKTGDRVKEKSTLLKIASYGVNQIGKFAGKKIKLEKKYDPKTDKSRVAFNTLGIGFSTPVK